MSKFTIKSGSYCPVCRGMTLCDCTHTMDELRSVLSGGHNKPTMNRPTIDRQTGETDRLFEKGSITWQT